MNNIHYALKDADNAWHSDRVPVKQTIEEFFHTSCKVPSSSYTSIV